MGKVTLQVHWTFVTETNPKGITYSNSKTPVAGDSIGEIVESDCESDSIETRDETEVGNKLIHAVLSPGSHSA